MKKLCAVFLCVLVCLPAVFCGRAADEAQAGADGILRFCQQSGGVGSTQALVDGVWSDSAGRGAEYFVLAAKQYQNGLDLTRYAASLKQYLAANTVSSATTREMLALMFVLSGVPDGYITQTLNEALGKLGVMSWVFALHLLNNGYTSTITTQKKTQQQLISLQLPDGGWAVAGSVSDVDVTAMALTALAPAYKQDGAVTAAVDGAVSLLAQRQNADGTLSSYGVKNAESISQTIIALSALNIDAATDSRFIKNGRTLFDALDSFRLSDGSCCHEIGGASNRLATAQALCAYVAAYRQAHGLGSLYYVPPAQRPTVTQPPTTKAHGGSLPDQLTTQPATAAPKPEKTTTAPAPQPEGHGTTAPAGTEPTTRTAAPTQPAQSTTQIHAEPTAAVSEVTAAVPAETNTVFRGEASALAETGEAGLTETGSIEATRPKTTVLSPKATDTTEVQAQPAKQKVNLKTVLLIAVWALAAAACGVLFLLGKRNRSWFIAVLLTAALLTGVLLVTNIQRKEEFFSAPEQPSGAGTITVTLSIRCDTIKPFAAENSAIPTDGVILKQSEYTLAPGSTAYDLLLLAARQNGFTFINKSAADNYYKDAYISTLAGLSEFDYGENSGWVFLINGQMAPVGCGAYELKDGDRVDWRYTRNLGEDVTGR